MTKKLIEQIKEAATEEIKDVQQTTEEFVAEIQSTPEIPKEEKKEIIAEVKETAKETVAEIKQEAKEEIKEVSGKTEPTIIVPENKKSDNDSLIWLLVGILVLAAGYYIYTLTRNEKTEDNERYS